MDYGLLTPPSVPPIDHRRGRRARRRSTHSAPRESARAARSGRCPRWPTRSSDALGRTARRTRRSQRRSCGARSAPSPLRERVPAASVKPRAVRLRGPALGRGGAAAARRRVEAACGRPEPGADAQLPARPAGATGRPQRDRRARLSALRGRRTADRGAHPTGGARALGAGRRQAGRCWSRRCACRPPGDPQPRDGRRLGRARRSGRRTAGRAARARRALSPSLGRGARSRGGRATSSSVRSRRCSSPTSCSSRSRCPRCGRGAAPRLSSTREPTATSRSPARRWSLAPGRRRRDSAARGRRQAGRARRRGRAGAARRRGAEEAAELAARRSRRRLPPRARRPSSCAARVGGGRFCHEDRGRDQRERTTRREVEPRTLLSDFIRHQAGLTGTHVGCEQGVCGACTVLLDGEPVRSCLMLAVQADGRSLVTVEGLAEPDGELHPLSARLPASPRAPVRVLHRRLPDVGEALLRRAPAPERATRSARRLAGNLCRCTGYEGIVAAVGWPRRSFRPGTGCVWQITRDIARNLPALSRGQRRAGIARRGVASWVSASSSVLRFDWGPRARAAATRRPCK